MSCDPVNIFTTANVTVAEVTAFLCVTPTPAFDKYVPELVAEAIVSPFFSVEFHERPLWVAPDDVGGDGPWTLRLQVAGGYAWADTRTLFAVHFCHGLHSKKGGVFFVLDYRRSFRSTIGPPTGNFVFGYRNFLCRNSGVVFPEDDRDYFSGYPFPGKYRENHSFRRLPAAVPAGINPTKQDSNPTLIVHLTADLRDASWSYFTLVSNSTESGEELDGPISMRVADPMWNELPGLRKEHPWAAA
jgi:hypothetical protein